MTSRDLTLLLLLSSIWGGSFLFIKVSLDDLAPVTIVAVRVSLGAAGLWAAFLAARCRRAAQSDDTPQKRGRRRDYVAASLLSMALPNLLISWGAQYIPSGTTAILVATSPLFAALAGPWWPVRGLERLVRAQLAGLGIGFAGAVVVVAGGQAIGVVAGRDALVGEVVVLVAAVLAGLGSLYNRRAFAGDPTLIPAAAQLTVATIILVPPALLWGRPDHIPARETIAAMTALGLGGTAAGYGLYYALIHRIGPAQAMMANYLSLATAVFYGAVLLGEEVTALTIGGVALIMTGVATTARARRGSE